MAKESVVIDTPEWQSFLKLGREVQLDMIVQTTQDVVNGRMDYVYMANHDSCLYIDGADGNPNEWSPSCLVAQILHRLGVPTADLYRFEGTPADSVAEMLGLPWQIGMVLMAMQSVQDNGGTWGVALETGACMRWSLTLRLMTMAAVAK